MEKERSKALTTANLITASRILLGVILLPLPAGEVAFLTVYLLAGLTDMLDGFVARKTHTQSSFGEKLDTAADIVFFAVAALKLIPVLSLPVWALAFGAALAVCKLMVLVLVWKERKLFFTCHSPAHKLTGLGLFLLPVAVLVMGAGITTCAIPVCILAGLSFVTEWREACRLIGEGKDENT